MNDWKRYLLPSLIKTNTECETEYITEYLTELYAVSLFDKRFEYEFALRI